MRNSGLVWWIGAFVLAALAGILTYGLLTSSIPVAAAGGDNTNTVAVIVAAENIPFRRSIREEDLTTRNLPVDAVPAGVAVTLDQVIDKMATVDLYANEPILTQQLVTPDVVTQQVALSVPDGKVVIAVPTQSKLISNRLVRPGDFVDLMATFQVQVESGEGKEATVKSFSLQQGLEIHAIILPGTTVEEGPQSLAIQEGGIFRTTDAGGQSVLLALDAQDALAMTFVLNVGGSLDVALRPKGDEGITETEAIDERWLTEHYNLE